MNETNADRDRPLAKPTVQLENGHTDPGHLRVPLLIENE